MQPMVEVNGDSMVYQLHDMLDRFVSIGAVFGFGRKAIIAYLNEQIKGEEEERAWAEDPRRHDIIYAPRVFGEGCIRPESEPT